MFGNADSERYRTTGVLPSGDKATRATGTGHFRSCFGSQLLQLSVTNENSDDISNPLVTQRQICCVMETCRRLADAYGLYRWEFWSGQRLNRSRKTIVWLQCWNQQLLGALPFQWCFPPMCNSVDLDLLSWSHEGHWRHHVGDCVPGGKKGSNNVKQCQTFKLRPCLHGLAGLFCLSFFWEGLSFGNGRLLRNWNLVIVWRHWPSRLMAWASGQPRSHHLRHLLHHSVWMANHLETK